MTPEEYKAKRQARIDRLQKRAAEAADNSNNYYQRSHVILDVIPLGQPILVGHYSEKHHRRDLAKADNLMRKSVEAHDYAKDLSRRANAVEENTAIFGDDPQAVTKLRDKIAQAEEFQKKMKLTNKLIRAKDTAALEAIYGPEKTAKLFESDFGGHIGVPCYALTNNNSNIRRMRLRLAELEAKRKAIPAPEREIGGVRLVENAEIDRIQLFFPDKPDEAMRTKLKRQGFRFSYEHMAWQRHLNNSGRWAAEFVLKGG